MSEYTYRRARRDLEAALAALIDRGHRLAHSRYARAQRGTLIRKARRVRADAIDVVTLAVLAERATGATWAEVAEAVGEDEAWVVEHYGTIEGQWRDGRGIDPAILGPWTLGNHG